MSKRLRNYRTWFQAYCRPRRTLWVSISSVLNAVSVLPRVEKDIVDVARCVQNLEKLALESHEHGSDESDTRRKEELLQWLSPLSFRAKQHDILSRRGPFTGDWLLKHETFRSWLDGNRPACLWCSGIPGAGRIVLTSIDIDHLESKMVKPGSAVACIYIDYKDKERQTMTTVLCSLLRQLLESMDAGPQEIQRIYDALPSDNKENTIDANQCVSLMRKFVEEQSCRVFLLFGALDECSDMDHYSNEVRSRMISAMKTLATFARIFVTSRSHVNLALSVPDYLYLEICDMDSNMQYYLEARKEEHSRLRNILMSHPTLAKHMEDTI